MMKRLVLVAVAAVFAASCATTGEAGSSSSSNRDVVERAELDELGATLQTAYDAVERLRPRWLRERSNPTAGIGANRVDPVVVYVNNIRRGGVSQLRQIQIRSVLRMNYVRPSDATTRYGLNHGSGAILITLLGGG